MNKLLGEADILIIGTGATGACLARELSRYKLRIILVEKEVDVCFGTSKANSGIVHSGIHDRPGTLKAELCVKGNRLFPYLADELDFLYQNNESIIIARDNSELPSLEELRKNGVSNGVTGLSLLSYQQLIGLEPNLASELTGGLLVPSGGIVAPFDLVFAMVENAVLNGVKLCLNTEVTGIDSLNKDFLVRTNRGVVKTKYLVNAAGIFSGHIARMIGDDSFSITPWKGEEFLLDSRLEGLVKRTIFPLPSKNSKGILVIPTVDGNIMIGPTAQKVRSYYDPATSSSGWEEIYCEVRKLVPSIQSKDLITSFAGLRAISEHEDFIIGPSEINPRFFHAAGIKSPGLTSAPAIAIYLANLLKEAGLRLVPNPDFRPERRVVRLRYLSHQKQADLISVDSTYGNIICRCEMVSEKEVRDAIRRGATTLDGVKLRTRTGMGRCQGGFCTPKLIQIIGDELGIPPESVTKNGPGSNLLIGRLREENGGNSHE